MDDTIDPDPTWPAAPAVAAPTGREFTDIEAARLIGRVLTLAAKKVGTDPYKDGLGVEEMCKRIIAGAPAVRLDPFSYRIAWWVLTGHLSIGQA